MDVAIYKVKQYTCLVVYGIQEFCNVCIEAVVVTWKGYMYVCGKQGKFWMYFCYREL